MEEHILQTPVPETWIRTDKAMPPEDQMVVGLYVGDEVDIGTYVIFQGAEWRKVRHIVTDETGILRIDSEPTTAPDLWGTTPRGH